MVVPTFVSFLPSVCVAFEYGKCEPYIAQEDVHEPTGSGKRTGSPSIMKNVLLCQMPGSQTVFINTK